MQKKILIVYEKMGKGHERMANILQDILAAPDVEFVMMAGSDMLKASSVQTVVRTWNGFIRKNRIKTVDILLNFLARLLWLPLEETRNVKQLHDRMDAIHPDAVICTADMYSKLLGVYTRQKGIPFYLVITDLSIFCDLVNPHAMNICYFKETIPAIRSYDFSLVYFSRPLDRSTSFRGKLAYVLAFYRDFIIHAFKNPIYRDIGTQMPSRNHAQVEVIGPLAEKKHYTHKDPIMCRTMLGIQNHDPIVLVASGSIGGKMLVDILRSICRRFCKPINLLVMCGNDTTVYQQICHTSTHSNLIHVKPYGYVNNFEDFLACADCVILRPSAGIFIESLLHGTPAIAMCPSTSNDKGSLEMIRKYRLGEICKNQADLADILIRILDRNLEYRANIRALLAEYPSTYPAISEHIRALVYTGRKIESECVVTPEAYAIPNPVTANSYASGTE